MQSPNFEHLKYAQQWIDAYPGAASYGCPGLTEAHPEIPFTETVGVDDSVPDAWPEEVCCRSLCFEGGTMLILFVVNVTSTS